MIGCDGVPNSGLVDDACGVCDGDGASCAVSPQARVTITGATVMSRGDSATFTVLVENPGGANLSELQLSLSVAPGRRIKNLSPGGLVALGDIPPGGSTSQVWSGRADKQGSATVTVELFRAGVSFRVETLGLTIQK